MPRTSRLAPAWPLSAVLLLSVCATGFSLWGCGERAAPAPDSAVAAPSAAEDGAIHVHRVISSEAREAYAGSAACVSCHKDEAGQNDSRHARTLAEVVFAEHADRFRQPSKLSDPQWDANYATAAADGRCTMQSTGITGKVQATAKWAFGSGDLAVTYLAEQPEGALQLRLTHFGRANRWAFTPGLGLGAHIDTPLGQILTPKEERLCFRCHTTALVKKDDETLDLRRSILGVGCETCHGPGRAHIEAAERGSAAGTMTRLADYRDRTSEKLCGQCHRAPDNVDLSKPGMKDNIARMQGLAMSMSACFTKGKIGCMTCHNPHKNADDTPRPAYNRICASCHQPAHATQKPCPLQPKGDCVSCHMPEQDAGMPTGPKFRTHWIKVWAEQVQP